MNTTRQQLEDFAQTFGIIIEHDAAAHGLTAALATSNGLLALQLLQQGRRHHDNHTTGGAHKLTDVAVHLNCLSCTQDGATPSDMCLFWQAEVLQIPTLESLDVCKSLRLNSLGHASMSAGSKQGNGCHYFQHTTEMPEQLVSPCSASCSFFCVGARSREAVTKLCDTLRSVCTPAGLVSTRHKRL